MRQKRFFVDGRKAPLTPRQFGHMAADLSLPNARSRVANFLSLPHTDDDTSLIYQISKQPQIALGHLMAISAAAFIAYVEMTIDIPNSQKQEIGDGLLEGYTKFFPNTDYISHLTGIYVASILFDIKNGGSVHPAGTETHRTLIKLLSQGYSGRDEIEDYEGLDSHMLGPFTDNYYLAIITDIRDFGKLRFAFA